MFQSPLLRNKYDSTNSNYGNSKKQPFITSHNQSSNPKYSTEGQLLKQKYDYNINCKNNNEPHLSQQNHSNNNNFMSSNSSHLSQNCPNADSDIKHQNKAPHNNSQNNQLICLLSDIYVEESSPLQTKSSQLRNRVKIDEKLLKHPKFQLNSDEEKFTNLQGLQSTIQAQNRNLRHQRHNHRQNPDPTKTTTTTNNPIYGGFIKHQPYSEYQEAGYETFDKKQMPLKPQNPFKVTQKYINRKSLLDRINLGKIIESGQSTNAANVNQTHHQGAIVRRANSSFDITQHSDNYLPLSSSLKNKAKINENIIYLNPQTNNNAEKPIFKGNLSSGLLKNNNNSQRQKPYLSNSHYQQYQHHKGLDNLPNLLAMHHKQLQNNLQVYSREKINSKNWSNDTKNHIEQNMKKNHSSLFERSQSQLSKRNLSSKGLQQQLRQEQIQSHNHLSSKNIKNRNIFQESASGAAFLQKEINEKIRQKQMQKFKKDGNQHSKQFNNLNGSTNIQNSHSRQFTFSEEKQHHKPNNTQSKGQRKGLKKLQINYHVSLSSLKSIIQKYLNPNSHNKYTLSFKIPKIFTQPNLFTPSQSHQQLHENSLYLFQALKIPSKDSLLIKRYSNCVHFLTTFNTTNSNIIMIWYFNGKRYLGGWQYHYLDEGSRNGLGLEWQPNKFIYYGEFKENKRHGLGVIKKGPNDVEAGEWVEGRLMESSSRREEQNEEGENQEWTVMREEKQRFRGKQYGLRSRNHQYWGQGRLEQYYDD